MNAVKRKIADVAELAHQAFAGHTLTTLADRGPFRQWRCGKPGCCNHAFRVTTWPGVLIVTGDLGALVLERDADMVAWARGAIHSVDYFASKAARELEVKEFDPDVAREWIDLRVAEYGMGAELAADLRSALEDGGEHAFSTALWESGHVDGEDWPECDNYTSAFLWCREALLWLLARLPEQGEDWSI